MKPEWGRPKWTGEGDGVDPDMETTAVTRQPHRGLGMPLHAFFKNGNTTEVRNKKPTGHAR